MVSRRKQAARDRRWDRYLATVDRTATVRTLRGCRCPRCVEYGQYVDYSASKITPGFFGKSRPQKRWFSKR